MEFETIRKEKEVTEEQIEEMWKKLGHQGNLTYERDTDPEENVPIKIIAGEIDGIKIRLVWSQRRGFSGNIDEEKIPEADIAQKLFEKYKDVAFQSSLVKNHIQRTEIKEKVEVFGPKTKVNQLLN